MSIKHEFIAGCLSLSFVDTLGGRAGVLVERLPEPDELYRWARAAGFDMRPQPILDEAGLIAARSLREAIHRCALASVEGGPGRRSDLNLINHWAARSPLRPEIAGTKLHWHAREPLSGLLSTLAEDAIRILVEPVRGRIRLCPECRMLFLDRSRSGLRRWCSSASGCGNRAKVRSFRARSAQSK